MTRFSALALAAGLFCSSVVPAHAGTQKQCEVAGVLVFQAAQARDRGVTYKAAIAAADKATEAYSKEVRSGYRTTIAVVYATTTYTPETLRALAISGCMQN